MSTTTVSGAGRQPTERLAILARRTSRRQTHLLMAAHASGPLPMLPPRWLDPVYELVIFDAPELDEGRSIHAWRVGEDRALCGATAVNHDCRPFLEVGAETERCPGCRRPICTYCRLLLGS